LMVEWARWFLSALPLSGGIDQPNPIPLRPWPSPNRRHLLPKPHQISSYILCQGPSCVLRLSWRRRKQHALLSHPHGPRRRRSVFGYAARSIPRNDRSQRGVVLRTRISRQRVPCRRITSLSLRLVQAQAAASLRPPSAREQQFRGDRLLLGQTSRNLPKARHGRSLRFA
jgi:hypothetical protein